MSVACQLTERVRIEYPASSNDGYGGKTVTWTELATVFAQVKPVFGAVNEHRVAEQRQADAGYRVIIRQRSDVTAAMRMVWKNRTLMIHSLHEHDTALNILTYEENL